MARPKRARVPLGDRSVNVEAQEAVNLKGKLSAQMLSMIDAEAEARIAAMRKSFSEEARRTTEQMEALIASLPEGVAEMPVEEYMKQKKFSLQDLLIQQINTRQ